MSPDYPDKNSCVVTAYSVAIQAPSDRETGAAVIIAGPSSMQRKLIFISPTLSGMPSRQGMLDPT